jgi:hypothetical protein
MYLNVILTIFVIVQIITMVLIYKWWDKYGRNIVKSFLDVKKSIPGNMGGVNPSNPFGNIPDMSAMMKQFENMTKNMGKK